jgi:hypothetical protein
MDNHISHVTLKETDVNYGDYCRIDTLTNNYGHHCIIKDVRNNYGNECTINRCVNNHGSNCKIVVVTGADYSRSTTKIVDGSRPEPPDNAIRDLGRGPVFHNVIMGGCGVTMTVTPDAVVMSRDSPETTKSHKAPVHILYLDDGTALEFNDQEEYELAAKELLGLSGDVPKSSKECGVCFEENAGTHYLICAREKGDAPILCDAAYCKPCVEKLLQCPLCRSTEFRRVRDI